MAVLSGLEPQKVFDYFEKICSVPHGSGNTKQVSDLCVSFAKELGLEYVEDDLNNLVIFKPGSHGLEDAEPVILQGHMDMVCAKTENSIKDMTKEGLDLYIDDGYIRAKDTSLGGDDGIAVAMILAILADDTLKHPPIEAVFTVDEEVGMDGAAGLDMSMLKGRRMLNLDSEEEGVFTVSCAGGLRTDCMIKASEQAEETCLNAVISIDGLIGGHSGVEINRGRGNAIKLMSRFLYRAYGECESLKLIGIEGGKFDNVICNSCIAEVAFSENDAPKLTALTEEYHTIYKTEFASSDP
ncbi:MAG: M20/M25/M40 family metallo-hydrolase, partial [Lachnospiraceae bacterium]|nr:M20/M25/M40 family metallo-hydrolase [Lachnospiraceae bacterium]